MDGDLDGFIEASLETGRIKRFNTSGRRQAAGRTDSKVYFRANKTRQQHRNKTKTKIIAERHCRQAGGTVPRGVAFPNDFPPA